MKDWYLARELAGLPGMPKSDYGVRLRAKRQGWESRPHHGHGGGLEYHIDSVMEEARQHLRGADCCNNQHPGRGENPKLDAMRDVVDQLRRDIAKIELTLVQAYAVLDAEVAP
jgi:hypothetical protein